ncbi:transglycosylase SLT domain-containing protein [Sodalis sp. dw_96]|uniref:transglycosylase SLT domain-containing protein n=1 Tax=Sodalis sp. dw_96 TaxID=2719794 RepID=UPI001BD68098|nr:transglycosylase SLT domain-containing protein [Sodalis sp. dw_96]
MLVRRTLSLLLLLASARASATCWSDAERHFGIEARLLQAIAITESNMNPRATGINKNGSHDIGLMQINSIHLPRLKTLGIDEQLLYDNSCLSVMVGASVLADMMKVYGYSWEAVGAYNAGTAADRRELRRRYAKRVWDRYAKLPAAGPATMPPG